MSVSQVDQEPSIRANTTVLLGNVAQYLGDTYCKKVKMVATCWATLTASWLQPLSAPFCSLTVCNCAIALVPCASPDTENLFTWDWDWNQKGITH